MKYIVLIAFSVLIGCEMPEDERCYTRYSYPVDVVGYSGLMLKATDQAFISFQQMESIYKEMEACLGLKAPSPTIEYQNFTELNMGGAWAVIMLVNQLIWINTADDLPPRNCHSDKQTLKHEYLHHLLYMNGKNSGHDNPEFMRCNAMGVKTCNGVPCHDS